MFQYKPTNNLTMVKGGARNLLDGSKAHSAEHFHREIVELEAASSEINSERVPDFINWLRVKLPLQGKFGIMLHDTNRYILKHRQNADVDTIVINNDNVVFLYSNSGRLVDSFNSNSWQDATDVMDLLEAVARASSGYRVALEDHQLSDNYFCIAGIDGEGKIYLPYETESDSDSHYELTGEQENVTVTAQATKQSNTQTGEVKMANTTNKATALINANKTAAQNAAKIEAGTIAINKLASLLAPKMPFGTSGYLKTPLGKVVLANVVNFAIQQYAANNPKAKVIGEAVMDAAALELVQSFNVGAMIDDLIGSVNLTGLVPDEDAEGLAKYRVTE